MDMSLISIALGEGFHPDAFHGGPPLVLLDIECAIKQGDFETASKLLAQLDLCASGRWATNSVIRMLKSAPDDILVNLMEHRTLPEDAYRQISAYYGHNKRAMQLICERGENFIDWRSLSDQGIRNVFECIPDVASKHSQDMLCNFEHTITDDTRMFLVGKGARVPKQFLFTYQFLNIISHDTYEGDLTRDVTDAALDLLFKENPHTRRKMWKFVDYGTVRVCPELVKGLLRNGMRDELTEIFSKHKEDMITHDMIQVMLRCKFTSFVSLVDISSLSLPSCFELVRNGIATRGLAVRLFQGRSEIPRYPFPHGIEYADLKTVAGVECMLAIGYSPAFLINKCTRHSMRYSMEPTSPGLVALFAMIILHPSIPKDKEAKHLAKIYRRHSAAEMHEALALREPPEGVSHTEWRCRVLPERFGIELPVDPSSGKAWDAVGRAMWR